MRGHDGDVALMTLATLMGSRQMELNLVLGCREVAGKEWAGNRRRGHTCEWRVCGADQEITVECTKKREESTRNSVRKQEQTGTNQAQDRMVARQTKGQTRWQHGRMPPSHRVPPTQTMGRTAQGQPRTRLA